MVKPTCEVFYEKNVNCVAQFHSSTYDEAMNDMKVKSLYLSFVSRDYDKNLQYLLKD